MLQVNLLQTNISVLTLYEQLIINLFHYMIFCFVIFLGNKGTVELNVYSNKRSMGSVYSYKRILYLSVLLKDSVSTIFETEIRRSNFHNDAEPDMN